MLGSEAAAPVAVCDMAVPVWPHSNAIDKIATEKIATPDRAAKLDDNLMACPPKSGTQMPPRHGFTIAYIPNRASLGWNISADNAPSIWLRKTLAGQLRFAAAGGFSLHILAKWKFP
jgi:hypothetical protein